ncbi:MAG: endonuclease/exonuclease/phosphatase family protein, partial [Planctomycetota bacterium]
MIVRFLLIACLTLANSAIVRGQVSGKADGVVRFATFNCSLYRDASGKLVGDLRKPNQPALKKVAEIIQRVNPDVLLLNEFDYDPSGEAARLLRENYLEQSQGGQAPVRYPHAFAAESNTGVDSGFDLNRDGKTGTPDDAFGFGRHPGQYGMLVLSKYPIDEVQLRTFQKFLWKDMPGALLPNPHKSSKTRCEEAPTAGCGVSAV